MMKQKQKQRQYQNQVVNLNVRNFYHPPSFKKQPKHRVKRVVDEKATTEYKIAVKRAVEKELFYQLNNLNNARNQLLTAEDAFKKKVKAEEAKRMLDFQERMKIRDHLVYLKEHQVAVEKELLHLKNMIKEGRQKPSPHVEPDEQEPTKKYAKHGDEQKENYKLNLGLANYKRTYAREVEMTPEERELAHSVKASYEEYKKKGGANEYYEKNDIPLVVDEELTNPEAVVSVRPDGKAIVSFRGTKDTMDVLEDINAVGGKEAYSIQMPKARKLVREAIGKYGEENVELAGHSWGGFKAGKIGGERGLKTTTFNPLLTPEIQQGGLHKILRTNYDPVSILTQHDDVIKTKVGKNPHTLDNFLVKEADTDAIALQRQGQIDGELLIASDMKDAIKEGKSFTEFISEFSPADSKNGELSSRMFKGSNFDELWKMSGGEYSPEEQEHFKRYPTGTKERDTIISADDINDFQESQASVRGVQFEDITDEANSPAFTHKGNEVRHLDDSSSVVFNSATGENTFIPDRKVNNPMDLEDILFGIDEGERVNAKVNDEILYNKKMYSAESVVGSSSSIQTGLDSAMEWKNKRKPFHEENSTSGSFDYHSQNPQDTMSIVSVEQKQVKDLGEGMTGEKMVKFDVSKNTEFEADSPFKAEAEGIEDAVSSASKHISASSVAKDLGKGLAVGVGASIIADKVVEKSGVKGHAKDYVRSGTTDALIGSTGGIQGAIGGAVGGVAGQGIRDIVEDKTEKTLELEGVKKKHAKAFTDIVGETTASAVEGAGIGAGAGAEGSALGALVGGGVGLITGTAEAIKEETGKGLKDVKDFFHKKTDKPQHHSTNLREGLLD